MIHTGSGNDDGNKIVFDKERNGETCKHLDPATSSDAIPEGLLEKEADLTAAHQTTTAQFVPAPRNDRGSTLNRREFQNDNYDKPLGMVDAVTSEKLRDVIAQRNLIIVIPQGVGDDEPAKECAIEHNPFSVDDIVELPVLPEEPVPKKRYGHCGEPCNCALEDEGEERQSLVAQEMTAEQIGITYGLPESDIEVDKNDGAEDNTGGELQHVRGRARCVDCDPVNPPNE